MTTTTTENNASEEECPPPPFPSSEKWTIGEPNTPYELNADNTAKDPVAFRDALLRDEEKRPEIEKEKDLAVHLLGEDVGKFQECLKDFIGKVSSSSAAAAALSANVVLFCFVLSRRRRCGPRCEIFLKFVPTMIFETREIYKQQSFATKAPLVFFSPFRSHLIIFSSVITIPSSSVTDQTSTRKRRSFRYAILRFDARAMHRPSRSNRPLRRHAKSRFTIRSVVPFIVASLDSREDASRAVSRGGRGER